MSVEGNGHKPIPELLQELIDVVVGMKEEQIATNARLDATNAKLDATNAKLDHTREDLGARIDATNRALDQTREDLGGRIDGVKLEVVALRATARADVREDAELRGRVDRIEQHLGIG